MEFYETIKRRKTCRDWQDRDIPIDAIKRIIEAGLKAPSHNHMREWEFIVLRTPEEKIKALRFTKEFLEKLDEQISFQNMPDKTIEQKMYKYAMPREYSMLFNAPYVIIPLFKSNGLRAQSVYELNDFASIWCVMENIFLAATAEGLGYSLSVPMNKEEENNVRNTLGVPDNYFMTAYIGIGYPDPKAKDVEQYHYTAEQKIHFGKW